MDFSHFSSHQIRSRIESVISINQKWLTVLIVIGVLIISAMISLIVTPPRSIYLLVLLVGGIGILILNRYPPFGVVVLIITALLVPSPYLPGGLNIAVILLAGLLILWLMRMVVVQRQLKLLPSRTIRPLFVFIVISLLAFGVGQLPWFGNTQHAPMDAQVGGLVIFILGAGAFMLTAHLISDLRWLQRMTWVFLIIGAIHIASWILPLGLGRLFQSGATDNSMFWTWLVALAFSQAFINRELRPGWRLMLVGLTLATLYVAYFMNSDWKSGYLPPLVSIAVIIGLRSWRAGLLLALVGILPAVGLVSEAIASDQYSYSTRLEAWIIILEMLKVNPILGFGPANYYWYTPLFPIRGWYVRFNSHNQYVDILAQTGLAGLISLMWFFAEVGRLGWQLRSRAPEGFAKAYVYGALGGLVGMLSAGILVDWFLPFVYNIGLTGFRGSMLAWLFLGGLVSIEQILKPQMT